jgi:hypothetical protein
VHVQAAKRVLRYLKATVDTKQTFRKNTRAKVNVCGYVDAAHGNDPLDNTSYTGYVFKLGGNVISWESRKQDSSSLSCTEAEYKGLNDAARECVHLHDLLNGLVEGITEGTCLSNLVSELID